tara:strand:+ start:2367 stop:3455 length:1089 start_codon:yes stop_codon:yes gene_type:complete
MKVAIVLGTRPEIIKFSSIIRELIKRKIDFILVHTNQHYSKNMDSLFFEQFDIPPPHYNLGIGSLDHNKQISKIISELSDIYRLEKPDVVLVQGDTNSTLGGAMAALPFSIPIAHIEGGLRSFDRTMPEEMNRIITDHISTFIFPPTENSYNNLINEGLADRKIFTVGNTIVDSFKENTEKVYNLLNKHKERNYGDFILVTLHRQENVDNFEKLKVFFEIIKYVSINSEYGIVFPIHPRTVKRFEEFGLYENLKKLDIDLIEPLGYFEFLSKQINAKLVVTDSGGIQEESCIFGVPCITLRENTERPETLELGSNVLTGLNLNKFRIAFKKTIGNSHKSWNHPYGDGFTGYKIIEILMKEIG